MVSPAELLAALATALALLFAWLLVRRGAPASPDPAGAFPKPAPRVEASGTSAPPSPGAQEPAAAPKSPEQPLAVLAEPAVPAEAEEQAAEAKQGEEQEQDGEEDPPPAEPEEDDEFRKNSWQPSSSSWRTTRRHLARCLMETCKSSSGCMTCRLPPPPLSKTAVP
ncbi:matrix-remodeling-associated protein 7 isoform X2 [Saccopteryx bilineata]|uniref:matrix-remodeling-associated protein 7 isoform X2 n=1 Tax=Saccopteryx bilineata TaxID=59482 RepID=UPI00338D7E1F